MAGLAVRASHVMDFDKHETGNSEFSDDIRKGIPIKVHPKFLIMLTV